MFMFYVLQVLLQYQTGTLNMSYSLYSMLCTVMELKKIYLIVNLMKEMEDVSNGRMLL